MSNVGLQDFYKQSDFSSQKVTEICEIQVKSKKQLTKIIRKLTSDKILVDICELFCDTW